MRHIAGHQLSVGEQMLVEQQQLLPLAREGFELAESSFPRVDAMGCVKCATNFYSTPLPTGTRVEAKVTAEEVEIWHEGRPVARHERCWSRQQKVLHLEHYLEALELKPGALAGTKPLEQWRRQGRWPASWDRFWAELNEQQGRPQGTREMIELLRLGTESWLGQAGGGDRTGGATGLRRRGGGALSAARRAIRATAPEVLEVAGLGQFERPPPTVSEYDQLLAAEVCR